MDIVSMVVNNPFRIVVPAMLMAVVVTGTTYAAAETGAAIGAPVVSSEGSVSPKSYGNADRRAHYLQLAAEEKALMEERSQNTSGIAQKYPRPVDSARYLWEYYTLMAQESSSASSSTTGN